MYNINHGERLDIFKRNEFLSLMRFLIDEKGYISLTETGKQKAEHIYERHQLLTALFRNLGVDEETASEDACRIEHYLSDKTFAAIKAHMDKYSS